MRKIALMLAGLAAGLAASAQTDTVYVSTRFTTHLVFSTEITYGDISSSENVGHRIAGQNKNILALKAMRPFGDFISVSVQEANDALHTFLVGYKDSPEQLVVEVGKVVDRNTPVGSTVVVQKETPRYEIHPPKNTRRKSVYEEREVTVTLPFPADPKAAAPKPSKVRKGEYSRGPLTMSEAVRSNREIFHIADREYGVSAQCENIFIYGNTITFVLSIVNESGKRFPCDDACFRVESRRHGKRVVPYVNNLTPRNSYGRVSTEPGSSSRVAYCFDTFTVLKDQIVVIDIKEADDQRQLRLVLSADDINKARIWK